MITWRNFNLGWDFSPAVDVWKEKNNLNKKYGVCIKIWAFRIQIMLLFLTYVISLAEIPVRAEIFACNQPWYYQSFCGHSRNFA